MTATRIVTAAARRSTLSGAPRAAALETKVPMPGSPVRAPGNPNHAALPAWRPCSAATHATTLIEGHRRLAEQIDRRRSRAWPDATFFADREDISNKNTCNRLWIYCLPDREVWN